MASTILEAYKLCYEVVLDLVGLVGHEIDGIDGIGGGEWKSA